MKTIIEVNNLTSLPVAKKSVKKAAETVLTEELKAENGEFEISIAFVGGRRIRQLNKQYRKIDALTDVLSFCEDDFLARLKREKLRRREFLGELIIFPGQVKEDAFTDGVSEKEELAWVVVHGVLHLLGFEHERGGKKAFLMRKKEKYYLEKLFKSQKTKRFKTAGIIRTK